jgi:hypothetical protein
MPSARSPKLKSLWVRNAGVRFRKGVPVDRDGNEVEITAEQAAALEKLPESFGVVVEVRKSTKRASGGD